MGNQCPDRTSALLALTDRCRRDGEWLVVEQVDGLSNGIGHILEGPDQLNTILEFTGNALEEFIAPDVGAVQDDEMGAFGKLHPPLPGRNLRKGIGTEEKVQDALWKTFLKTKYGIGSEGW